jgi:hypothetical protein
MARKDLLSEAIADAKAVKETALANAKLALEEAFTPKLQSMISAKLAEELDDEELDGEEMEDEMEMDSEGMYSEEEDMEDEIEMDSEGMYSEEEDMEDEMEMDSDEDEMTEEEDMEDEMEMDSEEDDLDLESIIRELEDEMGSEEDEMTEEEMESDEDEMTEEEMESDEEEMDLDEVIKTLKEMADEEEVSEEEGEDMEAELEEAYKTIKSLQSTINEVNLLNAKLLYTNKLFRTFDLNESQKVKVLENFDRTSSVREVKLVFSTIAENLNVAKKKKVVVKEGYASKATKSSAPKKQIISEGNEMAARWKKLAGLI